MGVVGIIENGVWVAIDDGRPSVNQKVDTHVIDVPRDGIDKIVANLAEVVRIAQGLSETDARRVRDFVVATSAMLSATTFLPSQDQARFERALREDVARKR